MLSVGIGRGIQTIPLAESRYRLCKLAVPTATSARVPDSLNAS